MRIMPFVFPLGILLIRAVSRVRVHHHATGPADDDVTTTGGATTIYLGLSPWSLASVRDVMELGFHTGVYAAWPAVDLART